MSKKIKTRKRRNQTSSRCNDAKKGTHIKCKMKTLKAQKYKSIFGATGGGSIRSNLRYFY
jgi:hypothetical protein